MENKDEVYEFIIKTINAQIRECWHMFVIEIPTHIEGDVEESIIKMKKHLENNEMVIGPIHHEENWIYMDFHGFKDGESCFDFSETCPCNGCRHPLF